MQTWDELISILEADGCMLIDDTDWAYPIYRCKYTGKMVGLDLDSELDDFMICYIYNALGLQPPAPLTEKGKVVKNIRNRIDNPEGDTI